MPNIPTAANFQSPYHIGNVTDLTGESLVQLRSALTNLGYLQPKDPSSPLDLGDIYALGAFQRTFGIGDYNGTINNDTWHSLLFANDQVVNAPQRGGQIDPNVAASLRLAAQPDAQGGGGLSGIANPDTITSSAPPTVYPNDLTPEEVQYFNSLRDRLNETYSQQQVGFDYQQGRIEADRARQQQILTERLGRSREKLPGAFAGRGLLDSGIYQGALQDYATQAYDANQELSNTYQDYLNQLGQQRQQSDYARTSGLADLEEQKRLRRSQYASQLRALQ